MNNIIPIKNQKNLIISAAVGGTIALSIISLFVFGVDNPNPEWPSYWRVRPLILTPLAGVAGGILFHTASNFRNTNLPVKILLTILGIFGYMIALWLGVVLGLDGTMWD